MPVKWSTKCMITFSPDTLAAYKQNITKYTVTIKWFVRHNQFDIIQGAANEFCEHSYSGHFFY